MAKKDLFGIFSPILGLKKDYPTILLGNTVNAENSNIVTKYGEVWSRLMREADLLDGNGVKTQTPDANPILHYHTFVKRATATQYLLAFTKAHIYLWNTSTLAWDLKWTCASVCTEWDTEDYNDMVIATNWVDKVLYWDTTGDFEPLDSSSGIEYGRSYANETNVDETSASGQKVLKVAATSGYSADDKVIGGRGTDREEEGIVDSVQAGVSLTLKENLIHEHTADIGTTVDADSNSGQKVLNVALTTGFSVDEFVKIDDGGDRSEVRKIYTIQSGVSLTFTVDLTYTHTQAQGDAVVGTSGQNDTVEEYESQYLIKAKYVTAHENYLELGYTYEDGVSKPQRIRWSDLGQAGTGCWRIGDAGGKETDGEEFIKGFGKYQGNLIIFKETSYILQWLVSTRAVWGWKLMPSSIGCQSNHSIINDPAGRLYFYASDNTIRDIETGEISGDIDPIIKLINPEYAYLVYAFYMAESEDIWWSIPVGSNSNNKIVTLNKKKKWGEIDISTPAFGEYKEE